MREIVFDTETTGLNPLAGDRIVEIGCVELVNRVETGRTFHAYFNPDRPMPSGAEAVHGLTDAFLADKLDRILARQMPDAEKRARADFVIPTGGDLEETRRAVRRIVACLARSGDS